MIYSLDVESKMGLIFNNNWVEVTSYTTTMTTTTTTMAITKDENYSNKKLNKTLILKNTNHKSHVTDEHLNLYNKYIIIKQSIDKSLSSPQVEWFQIRNLYNTMPPLLGSWKSGIFFWRLEEASECRRSWNEFAWLCWESYEWLIGLQSNNERRGEMSKWQATKSQHQQETKEKKGVWSAQESKKEKRLK